MQNISLFDLSGDFVKCILKEGSIYFLQFWLHIFCTLFKTCRHFAQQNKNARQFLSNQRAFAISEWRDSNSRPPAPKAGALPTAQHPVIRRHGCTAGIFNLFSIPFLVPFVNTLSQLKERKPLPMISLELTMVIKL